MVSIQEEALAIRFWEVVDSDMREFVKNRGLSHQRGHSLPAPYELKALTKDGQAKWIDVAVSAFQYGGQTDILATAYDIT